MTQADQAPTAIDFRHSAGLPDVLRQLGGSLLVSTYQAGQLIAIGLDESGQVNFSFRRFDKAMGVAVDATTIIVGGRDQVWTLRQRPDIAGRIPPTGRYDRCYLPRSSVFTGAFQGHELAWGRAADGRPDLWVVNTGFSALVGLHPDHNFVRRWQPPFITAMANEDRCHLNGMALRDGLPAYVTCLAPSDERGGWRRLPPDSGVVLDVPSGQVVTSGMHMPHSPRWYGGHLFVLNSGMGHLQRVDTASGERATIAALPGYTRGLAFHGNLAFVGLSRIRETSTFGRVPLVDHHDELKCGVGVIDITTGQTVATLEFLNGVEEIFDLQLLPGARSVALSGSSNDEIWVSA